MKAKHSPGKIIIPPFVFPEKHEMETASFLANLGQDVEFLKPSQTKGSKTPDIKMNGRLWEVKAPMGKSKNTILNALRRGVKQSKYIVIDLRITQIDDESAVKQLQNSIAKVKSIKKVIVILKTSKVIELS